MVLGMTPYFFIKDKGKSMAEISSEEKNLISHRAKAIQKLISLLEDIII